LRLLKFRFAEFYPEAPLKNPTKERILGAEGQFRHPG
jgi:hypothetical protein